MEVLDETLTSEMPFRTQPRRVLLKPMWGLGAPELKGYAKLKFKGSSKPLQGEVDQEEEEEEEEEESSGAGPNVFSAVVEKPPSSDSSFDSSWVVAVAVLALALALAVAALARLK